MALPTRSQVAVAVLTVLAVGGCTESVPPRRPISHVALSLQTSTSDVPITDLGTLGGSSSEAKGINNRGHVTGTATNAIGETHAFVWTAGGGMRQIFPGAWYSTASAINDVGQVAGETYLTDPYPSAFRWSENEGARDLGRVGCCEVHVRGMNDDGQVVGMEWDEVLSTANAVLWTEAEGMHTLSGAYPDYSWANGINDNGQVVGADGGIAFVWTAATGMRHFAGNANPSWAYAINNLGQIVGANFPDGFTGRAFLWSEARGMRELGTLGGTESVALAINASGQVVGWSRVVSGEPHAFLWTEEAGMRDLGTLSGATSSSANAINDEGQIVGSSTFASGVSRAVLWSPAGAPPPPPSVPNAPSEARARPAGSMSVLVSWRDNSTNENAFSLQRSSDGTGTWTEVVRTAASVTSYSDNGRPSEAQVCYRVTAFGNDGESAPSNTTCTTPPAAPSGLTAVKDATTPWSKINLTWADNSNVEESYEIQRCAGSSCADYTVIATIAANTTHYSDGTVAVNATYSYRVRANKDGGASDVSSAAGVTTDPYPNAAPVARYAWNCTNTSCTFDATSSSDDSGIASYGWAFGDGGTATGRVVSRTYTTRNSYTVTLTVTDVGAPPRSGAAACSVIAGKGKSSGSCP